MDNEPKSDDKLLYECNLCHQIFKWKDRKPHLNHYSYKVAI